MARLLERDAELDTLARAVESAAAGRGCTALILGEAGIGKTSLVQAFLAAVPPRIRVLAGSCEDLLTPRALGPLRDAAHGADGPLARAFANGADPNAVFTAVADELAGPPSPTVLVIDDAHWADGATLDVVRYVSRRISGLPAVLVVTYRDDEVDATHPLRQALGAMAGTTTVRVRLARLSVPAVGELVGDADVDLEELYGMTNGNPFFVTEVLAAPDADLPPTVVDAVLARVGKLSPAARAAVERCAVVPSGIELELLRTMEPDLAAIAEAERVGVLTARGGRMAFRHELARRAVATSLPTATRLRLNAEVLHAMVQESRPDPFRVLHHAVEAGDDDAVRIYGKIAARDAQRAGACLQEAACYAQVLARADGLSFAAQAELDEAYSWALSNSNQLHAATEAAARAVTLWEHQGDATRLARALITLSRQQFLTRQTDVAFGSAQRALEVTTPQGDTVDYALARMNLGGMHILLDREEAGIRVLSDALPLAERVGSFGTVSLCHNYLGSARMQLGHPEGRDEIVKSVEIATRRGNHELVMRGYYNLVEGCWRLGQYPEALEFVDQAEAYCQDREFGVYRYMIAARRYRMMALQGRWPEAIAGLHEMLDGQSDSGMIGRETLPVLSRLLIRTGDPDAEAFIDQAVRYARQADVLEWLVPTGLAVIERAWLLGRPSLAGDWPQLLLDRTDRPGCALQRGELLRYLSRLGAAVPEFADCPEPYAAGLRGDWEAAAAAWQDIGHPYERALELAGSGEPAATSEAYRILDLLGAGPATALVRLRLRELGITRAPRRPSAETRQNVAGLTARQIEIVRLLAGGLTNAEIAALLVLSTRTIDHHVASAFQKLGVNNRRDAAALVNSLALADQHV